MNILQVMGCTSDQYASMERYLVHKARRLSGQNSVLTVMYENTPRSQAFTDDLTAAGGQLLKDRMSSSHDLSFLLRLRKRVRVQGIDLVHAYFTPTCHHVAWFLRVTGFRHVVRTAANMPIPNGRVPSHAVCWRHRLLAASVERILCRSVGVRDCYATLGVPSWKLAVADGGCDTNRYTFLPRERRQLRDELGAGESQIVLGVSCRLVRVKRLDRLLHRLSEVRTSTPGLVLWIAGEGPERPRMEQLVCELGLQQQVRLLGQREDMASFYSAVDCFCLPSEAEGMSNSILEAMATERPVLASDIPPNRGVVIPGRGGQLLDFDSPDAFQAALRLLSTPEASRAMGQFNRERVVKEFSLDARLNRELEVYAAVTKRGGIPSHAQA